MVRPESLMLKKSKKKESNQVKWKSQSQKKKQNKAKNKRIKQLEQFKRKSINTVSK